jgi:tetratricopeptide (TPR) repeat protein
MKRFAFKDPFLRSLSAERSSALRQLLSGWELWRPTFLNTLDRWFGNFRPDDKELAFKLLAGIDYYSPARFEAAVSGLCRRVFDRLKEEGFECIPILLVTPPGGGDSAHSHAYLIRKAWGLPVEQVCTADQLKAFAVSETALVLFNDTHGSGKQFLREVWTFVGRLSPRPRAIFVAAIAVAQEALDRFRAELPYDVHIIPGEPARNAHEFFTADEFERLFELGREVYPAHPDGYGGTALMIAYHFQCPNNSLPLIWADGRNNAAEGVALSWSPLFTYRPKRRPDVAEVKRIKRGRVTSLDLEASAREHVDRARQVVRVDDLLRLPHGAKELDAAARMIGALAPSLLKDVQAGRPDAFVAARRVEELIGRIVGEDERHIHLLQDRSVLRDYQGRFDEALDDVMKLIDSSKEVVPAALVQAGSLLMTLGRWPQAREMLHRGYESATDESDKVKALEYMLWIEDYQGRRDYVIGRSLELLQRSAEIDPFTAMSVEHRLGRAIFAKALDKGDRELMEVALGRLRSAWRAADRLGIVQPYHANWVYRVSNELGNRDRDKLLDEAIETAREFGDGGWAGHVKLSLANRAIAGEQWPRAADYLLQALDVWTTRPYPKGLFDVSCRLGRVYKEMGGPHRIDSAMYWRMAERIGARLGLPERWGARRHLEEVSQQSPFDRSQLPKRLDERLAERFLERFIDG